MALNPPVFDADMCSLGRLAVSDCRACAAACPVAALEAEGDSLTLSEAACTGCGACAAACPQRAVSLAHIAPIAAGLRPDQGRAVLVCPELPGGSLCLQALGLEALAQLWRAGVRNLALAHAECASCPNGVGLAFAELLADFNALLHDRALPRLQATPATPRDIARLPRLADPQDRPSSRRALFGGLTPAPQGPALAWLQGMGSAKSGARFAMSPAIDVTLCSGCDACLKVCPEAALMLIKADSGELSYHFNPAACTGCALCVDVCEPDAISLHALSPGQPDLALEAFRCAACGVSVHVPLGRAPGGKSPGEQAPGGLCPVCTKTCHASRLFVVIG